MKKLIFLSLMSLCAFTVSAQNYSSPGVPPGTTSTTISARVKPATPDSLAQIWLGIGGNKFYRMSTGIDDIVFSAVNFKGAGTISDKLDLNNSIHIRDTTFSGKSIIMGSVTDTTRRHIWAYREIGGLYYRAGFGVTALDGGGWQLINANEGETNSRSIQFGKSRNYPTISFDGVTTYPIATAFIPDSTTATKVVAINADGTFSKVPFSGGGGVTIPQVDSIALAKSDSVKLTVPTLYTQDGTITPNGGLRSVLLNDNEIDWIGHYPSNDVYTKMWPSGNVGINVASGQSDNGYALYITNSGSAGYVNFGGGLIIDASSNVGIGSTLTNLNIRGSTINVKGTGFTGYVKATNGDLSAVTTIPYSDITGGPSGTGTVTSITPGVGFLSHTPITASGTMNVDTASTIQSIDNFFPKGDTRYYKASNPSGYISTISGISAGGDLTGTYPNPTLLNASVIGKVLTGYSSSAGTVASTDNILQAIQKLNGNDALKAPIASPTFTGTVTIPNGGVFGTPTSLTLTNATGLPNAGLANSTISGVALGSNLAALTATDATLTFSGSYTGATARTVGLNLGNANTWTANQIVSLSSLATTPSNGLEVVNSTAATSGAPNQYSPSLHFGSQVWNTTATAANNWADWRVHISTASSSTPQGTLDFDYSLSTTSTPSYVNKMSLDKNGSLTISNSISALNATFNGMTNTTGGLNTSGSNIWSPASTLNASAQTVSQVLYGSASTVNLRIAIAGTASATTVANGNYYANTVIGKSPIALTTSAVVPWASNLVVTAPGTITLNSGSITNQANLYVDAPGSSATNNYAAYFAGGNVNIQGLTASKVVFTDASKNLTSTGIGTSSQYIAGDGSLGTIGARPHTIFTPTTGGTVSLTNNQYNIINPAGTLVALTVNLPSSPANNDCVFIKYTQSVTTVTYGNGTVVDGITAPTAGGLVVLTYDSGTTSWY